MCVDSLENNQSQGICFLISKYSCRLHNELFLYLFCRQEFIKKKKSEYLADSGGELVLLMLDQVLHLVLVLSIQKKAFTPSLIIAGWAEQLVTSAYELLLSMVPYDGCSFWASIVLSVE